MRLTLVTPPAVEPVSLDDLKNHLKVDCDDDDALIATLGKAARRYVESAKKQSLVTQTWRLYLDSFPSAGGYYNRAIREAWPSLGGLPSGLGFYPGMVPNSTGVIDIPLAPLQAIVDVQYYDFSDTIQTVDPSTYVVSLGAPARIQPNYSRVWPISRPSIDSVRITFTAGWGDTAADVPETDIVAIKLLAAHWYYHREAVSEGGFAPVPLAVDSLLGATEHGSYT